MECIACGSSWNGKFALGLGSRLLERLGIRLKGVMGGMDRRLGLGSLDFLLASPCRGSVEIPSSSPNSNGRTHSTATGGRSTAGDPGRSIRSGRGASTSCSSLKICGTSSLSSWTSVLFATLTTSPCPGARLGGKGEESPSEPRSPPSVSDLAVAGDDVLAIKVDVSTAEDPSVIAPAAAAIPLNVVSVPVPDPVPDIAPTPARPQSLRD